MYLKALVFQTNCLYSSRKYFIMTLSIKQKMLLITAAKMVATAAAVVGGAYLLKAYAEKVCNLTGDVVDVASEQVVGG